MQRTFHDPQDQALYELMRDKAAPALVAYVHRVLTQARQRGVKTLYFLARDGYLLLDIARRLCKEDSLDIDCRYLYCSRRSLRLPSYHLLGEEAYDLLFSASKHIGFAEVFQRAHLDDVQSKAVLDELGISDKEAAILWNAPDIAAWRQRLHASALFNRYLQENSRIAYEHTIAYFRQEGLFDQPCVTLVDSGWAGSSQRSIRQMMTAAGFTGSFAGFYCGLILQPKEDADGDYLPWLFSAKANYWRKVLFNLNMFECLLSAPHGMTMTYAEENGRMQPVLGTSPDDAEAALIAVKNAGVQDGLDLCCQCDWRTPAFAIRAVRRLQNLLAHPRAQDVHTLNRFVFSDDIGAENKAAMVCDEAAATCWDCFVPVRLWRKIANSPKADRFHPYWGYGTSALITNPLKRAWFWLNAFLWEMLKYMG